MASDVGELKSCIFIYLFMPAQSYCWSPIWSPHGKHFGAAPLSQIWKCLKANFYTFLSFFSRTYLLRFCSISRGTSTGFPVQPAFPLRPVGTPACSPTGRGPAAGSSFRRRSPDWTRPRCLLSQTLLTCWRIEREAIIEKPLRLSDYFIMRTVQTLAKLVYLLSWSFWLRSFNKFNCWTKACRITRSFTWKICFKAWHFWGG